MVFSSNPLALSVPEAAFESWLRDNGYLEVLDQRTSDLHRISSSAVPSTTPTTTTTSTIIISTTTVTGLFVSFVSRIATLFSLFAFFNPFIKLTADDFSGKTPPWTTAFIGSFDSYSFPSSSSQAHMRVHENVKRYARNYAVLFFLIFACSLYEMPISLVGLISCFAMWDAFKYCSERWGLDQYPLIRQCLVNVALCVTAVILFCSNVHKALLWAVGISYIGMVLHGAFRKLTPTKQHSRGR